MTATPLRLAVVDQGFWPLDAWRQALWQVTHPLVGHDTGGPEHCRNIHPLLRQLDGMGANCRIGRTHTDIAPVGCCGRNQVPLTGPPPSIWRRAALFEFPNIRRLHGEQIDVAHLQLVEAETVCHRSGEIQHIHLERRRLFVPVSLDFRQEAVEIVGQ